MSDVDRTTQTQKTIHTHNEASGIVELFDDVLIKHGISVPSPEDDDRDADDRLGLYGSVYSDLLDAVEERLIAMAGLVEAGAKVVSHVFE